MRINALLKSISRFFSWITDVNSLWKLILLFLFGIVLVVFIIPSLFLSLFCLLSFITNSLLYVIAQWQVGIRQKLVIAVLGFLFLSLIVGCCWLNKITIIQWWRNNKLKIFLDRVGRIERPYQDYISYAILALGLLIFGALLPIPTEFLGTPSYKLWSNVFNLDNDTYNSYINSISQILVGVSASIVAASLIEIFVGVRKIYEREELRDKIKIFFGCNHDNNNLKNPKTVIIIHGYRLDGINALSEQERISFDNAIDQFPYLDPKQLQNILNADNEYGSKADIMAASYIQRLFNKSGFNPPEILNDNQVNTTFKNLLDEHKYNCFIIIGIGNSNFIHYLQDNDQLDHPDRTNNILFNPQKEYINCNCFSDTDTGGGQTVDCLDTHSAKYGQLLKFKVINKTETNNNTETNNTTKEKMVFILGGNTALYTEKLAKYLFDNFDKDSSNEPNKNFYALYEKIYDHRREGIYRFMGNDFNQNNQNLETNLSIKHQKNSFNFIAKFDGTSNPANIDDINLLGFPCLAFEDDNNNVFPISADKNFGKFREILYQESQND